MARSSRPVGRDRDSPALMTAVTSPGASTVTSSRRSWESELNTTTGWERPEVSMALTWRAERIVDQVVPSDSRICA
jgi:hypothetical protein